MVCGCVIFYEINSGVGLIWVQSPGKNTKSTPPHIKYRIRNDICIIINDNPLNL